MIDAWEAAKAQCIHHWLQYCGPKFEYQAHQLRIFVIGFIYLTDTVLFFIVNIKMNRSCG